MKKIIVLLTTGILLSGCNSSNQHKDNTTSQMKSNSKADIIFDAAHGVTAGEADWVINGGFSTFNDDIIKEGITTTSTGYNDEITLGLLKQYKAFIMPEPNIPLKTSEQDAIKTYVEQGGSVMMIADHYNADRNLNRFDASEIFNGYRRGAFDDITKGMKRDEIQSDRMQNVKSSDYLSETFGVRFRYNALDDVVLSAKDEDNVFGILDGVTKVNMHAGSTILITDKKKAKGVLYPESLSSRDKWGHAVDQGVYTKGYKDEGAFVAISKLGKGKAVFIGDSSIVEDSTPKYVREDNGQSKNTYDGIREMDHQRLMQNLVSWMIKQEDFTSFEGEIDLDDETKVIDFEIPQNSSEPKEEPWGTPGHDYKWYDPSTFEDGSFGKDENVITSKGNDDDKRKDNYNDNKKNSNAPISKSGTDVDVEYPNTVSVGEHFTVDIFTKEQVNQVAIELIDEDGEQVGLFDGKPPGKSRSYDTKYKENRFHCYFHGKIAREANGKITLKVYSGNQIIQEETMMVR
ncbi:DNA-binding protein [Macrococcus animalis]|uniref:DNA-binding protein n=1 Tax=Macrococcus animalis TaxID=3395467 RepID=UPI0039BE3892